MAWQRIGSVKQVADFRQLMENLSVFLPCDDRPLSAAEGSPLATSMKLGRATIGNRWAIHPMEGWDGTGDGQPSELTQTRWSRFGQSGAKLIWGGEAVAVRHDGRANPNQLLYTAANEQSLGSLLTTLKNAHRESFGESALDDLYVGLQLTHSGRYSRPNHKSRLEPRIAYHHPVLDARCQIDPNDDAVVISDGEVRQLIEDYVVAAKGAARLGFQFVDVKCCHGYLGHEFLSAFNRPGPYGGDLAGRTRFLRETIAAIQTECPTLEIGVRLSLFDSLPFQPDPATSIPGRLGPGVPSVSIDAATADYPVFGGRRDQPLIMDLTEPIALVRQLRDDYNVRLFNLSAGSPYYNPHLQRPAYYPPSDGYQPPEDPLVGCARQITAVREVKQAIPDVLLVGTAYTYLQEYLPHVAQSVVREGWVDSVGIGRLVLSDWTFPAKVLRGDDYRHDKKICRTFSDCTTAPRHGLVSGCYPLDDLYKQSPEASELKEIKAKQKSS
ncbi:MAG: NADH:flavin oxidoreductase [Planctomycetaceae bacterium]